MSIFNGHEDQSTEELAKELGISDLSVVENAGREITETLDENKDIKVKNTDSNIAKNINTNHIQIDGILCTSNYSLEDLEKGMSLYTKDGSLKVNIVQFHDDGSITTTQGKGERTTLPWNAVKAIYFLPKQEKDWKNTDKRIPLSDISQKYGGLPETLFNKGAYVKNHQSNAFSMSIGKAYKTNIGYDIHFPFSLEGWNKDSFLETMIHKDCLIKYKLELEGFDTKVYTTTEINSLDELKKGDQIISSSNENLHLTIGEIVEIGNLAPISNTDGVSIKIPGGFKMVSINKLKENYKLITKIIDKEIETIEWTDNFKIKDLKKGMIIRSEKMILQGYINGFEDGNVLVEIGDQILEISANDILESFEVNDLDIIRDSKITIKNINDFRLGMLIESNLGHRYKIVSINPVDNMIRFVSNNGTISEFGTVSELSLVNFFLNYKKTAIIGEQYYDDNEFIPNINWAQYLDREPVWTKNYTFGKLKKDMAILIMKEGVINDIDNEGYCNIDWDNGNTNKVSLTEIQNGKIGENKIVQTFTKDKDGTLIPNDSSNGTKKGMTIHEYIPGKIHTIDKQDELLSIELNDLSQNLYSSDVLKQYNVYMDMRIQTLFMNTLHKGMLIKKRTENTMYTIHEVRNNGDKTLIIATYPHNDFKFTIDGEKFVENRSVVELLD